MSNRLKDLIDTYLVKHGNNGFVLLGQVLDRDAKTIRRWKDGGAVPNAHLAYKLALACGCTEEDALSVAKEAFSGVTEKTA